MKWAMAFVPRFLFPLGVLSCLPLACSSSNDGTPNTVPVPPSGGTAAGGSASGGTTGVVPTGGTGGSGGTSTAGAAGGPDGTGMACMMTPDCIGTGLVCNAMKMCACTHDVPKICGTGAAAACVNLQTDPANCGTCAKMCDAGAACVAGACGTKPTDVATATACGGGVRMTIQGTDLYWVEPMTGKVRTVPVAGGTPKDVATAQAMPSQNVSDATGLYWIDDGAATAGSTIMTVKLPLATPPVPVPFKTKAGAMDKILGITVNGGKLYYTLATDVHQLATTDTAGAADVKVGIAVNYDDPMNPIVSGVPSALASNGTEVIWTTGVRNGVEAHTTAAPVPADVKDQTGYYKLGKSVGELLLTDVAIDAMFGYWADAEKFETGPVTSTDSIYKIVAASPTNSPILTFAINATKMYAATSDGFLFTHALAAPADPDPMPPTLIARDQMKVSSIVVDAAKLYWVTDDCMIRSTGL